MPIDWCAIALGGDSVWSIGQLDKRSLAQLNQLVRKGVLIKTRQAWNGGGPIKTVYHLPGYDIAAEQHKSRIKMLWAFAMDEIRRHAEHNQT